MTEKQHILTCSSIDELIRVARMPLSAYPTNQFALWTIEFPINKADYDELAGNTINLFGVSDDSRCSTSKKTIAYSSNMSGPTFTVDNPFIVTAVCAMLQGEPISAQIEGNQFGPKSYIESLGNNPASPLNLRNQVALLQALLGTEDDLDANFFACPSVLDWGGATWRFIWALMQSWRLVFECPHSGFENLIDERLADLGSCCAHTSFEGFGDSDIPLTYLVRRVNARLADITLPTSLTMPADDYTAVAESGYFFPLNAEQNSDGEITPYHYAKDRVAYGCPTNIGQYETWCRLPVPMPLDTGTKIKLTLERRKGDEDYWYRSLDEAIMRRCAGPVPAITSCNFPLAETGVTAQPTGGIACQTQIPAGMVRVGLGLKGFQVRLGTCALWRRVLQDKDLLMQLLQGEFEPGGAGCVGAPINSELMERYSDDKELMRQVGVPAGFVGQPDR